MSKLYHVRWELTEEADSPEEAVEMAFNRLQEHENDWIWLVKNDETGETVEIDFEYNPPEVIEIKPRP